MNQGSMRLDGGVGIVNHRWTFLLQGILGQGHLPLITVASVAEIVLADVKMRIREAGMQEGALATSLQANEDDDNGV